VTTVFLDPVGCPDAAFTARMVSSAPGVRLRVLSWRPQKPAPGGRILFVPGWASAVQGWVPVLRQLVCRWPVDYVETREKVSAEFDGSLTASMFALPAMAADLVIVAKALAMEPAETVVIGSSLGATVLLEAMKESRFNPRAGFLIAPTCSFRFPPLTRAVLALPSASYHLLKHAVLYYLEHFRVDVEHEPEQMQRYRDTLLTAEPERLKLSAQAVHGYSVWRGLKTVHVPIAVAHADTDKLHTSSDARRLVRLLPRGVDLRCPSNRHMHSADIVKDLVRFATALEASL